MICINPVRNTFISTLSAWSKKFVNISLKIFFSFLKIIYICTRYLLKTMRKNHTYCRVLRFLRISLGVLVIAVKRANRAVSNMYAGVYSTLCLYQSARAMRFTGHSGLVAKLADALVQGASSKWSEGSIPSEATNYLYYINTIHYEKVF